MSKPPRARTNASPKRRAKRRTAGKSQLLEQCVEQLQMVGFQLFQSKKLFDRAVVIPARHVICNYPHETAYGTPGRKEAIIIAPNNGFSFFVPDDDDTVRIVIEAKWQEGSGSTDEKLPFVYEAFLTSPIKNWVVILDGGFWSKASRGKAAAAWLQAKAPGPPGRRLYVVDRREFNDLARRAWGQQS